MIKIVILCAVAIQIGKLIRKNVFKPKLLIFLIKQQPVMNLIRIVQKGHLIGVKM